MESLNDLIWNEEDEDIVDVTRDYLTEIVCLIACQYEGASYVSCEPIPSVYFDGC